MLSVAPRGVPEGFRRYYLWGFRFFLFGVVTHLHCRVFWRYGIVSDAHDRCIGFRLVLARPPGIEG